MLQPRLLSAPLACRCSTRSSRGSRPIDAVIAASKKVLATSAGDSPTISSHRSLNNLRHTRQYSQSSAVPPAFCFDIDGVLKQGSYVLPEAKEILQILNGNNKRNIKFPFICVTNGGGTLETARAKKLTQELGVPIGLHQIVQSHTIFRKLAAQYADKPVLVVGGKDDNVRQVAQDYGFKHAYIPEDIIHWSHSVWPFQHLSDREIAYARKGVDFSKIQFAAVLVFHDSRDWGRDIQLVTDLVRSVDGVLGTHKDPKDPSQWRPEAQMPVYFSNPDLLWGNEFPQPRYGQGALQESMAAVYKTVTGHELQRHVGGKPTRATYDFSANMLFSAIAATRQGLTIGLDGSGVDLHAQSTSPAFDGRVYMVGDNPASDIAGANAFGWESILVRTGVFRGKDENDAAHKPTVIQPNVWEAVRWALEREGFGGVF